MGGGTESASVATGSWNYLFFNHGGKAEIDFYRFDEDREPKHFTLTVNGKKDISEGGAITAVYLEKRDEIHLYYITSKPNDKTEHIIREVTLREASKVSDPSNWTDEGQDLNKKKFEIDSTSFLTSAVNSEGLPRIFYTKDNEVSGAFFDPISAKSTKKDWTATALTGVSV